MHRTIQRILAGLLVGATVVAGSATPAHADPWDFDCITTSQGELCIIQRDNGYDALFRSTWHTGPVDFNLHAIVVLPNTKEQYGTKGPFDTRPGQRNSYFFAVGYKPSAQVCLYARDYAFTPFCTDGLYTEM